MITTGVNPGNAVLAGYDLPAGLLVTVKVSASDKVRVYLTDGDGKAAFLDGEPEFFAQVRSLDALDHIVSTVLPSRAKWFLIVHNPTKALARVEYDLLIGTHAVPTIFAACYTFISAAIITTLILAYMSIISLLICAVYILLKGVLNYAFL
jgi:hypothetical protein